jgi:membrane protein DedA with SNARE-associated domain
MTFLGYFLGKVLEPKQIEHVVYLIIVISVTPIVIAYLKKRFGKKTEGPGPAHPPSA